MVRSVFNAQGHYIGKIWGTQNWGSQTIGEFYCCSAGSKKVHGPFKVLADAETRVRAFHGALETLKKPEPVQLNLGLVMPRRLFH